MADDTKKKGTLSIGTLGANRTSKNSGVAVEVRRSRFGAAPASAAKPAVTGDSEMARRLKVLEEAKKNKEVEEKRREEERTQAATLQKLKQETEAEKTAREAALAQKKKEQEEEAKAAEEAKKAAPSAENIVEAQAAAAAPAAGHGHRKTLTVDNDYQKKKKTGGKQERDLTAKRGRNAYMDDLEQRFRTRKKERSATRGMEGAANTPQEKVSREVIIPEFITVQELASRMAEKAAEVVKKLMLMGQMVTVNQTIDQDTAALVVEEFGHTYKFFNEDEVEEGLSGEEDKVEDMVTRPPVVTVMGHVDHGKTSLLDALRKARVAAGEAGGITQHIGAYQVENKSGKLITFLDTPGHAAFTSMRARGAQATDVVILVVAADDGVMPQTIEAIQHAKDAGVPIVVAINKMDKPEADPMRVKNELLSHELITEDFGGDVVAVPISAITGQGLEELEEMVLLQADVMELKANPNRAAEGVIVESSLDKGRGPVATVIVQRGTLKQGDIVVAGATWGRVRALVNDLGERVTEAGPSTPVEVLGLQSVPEAGDDFVCVADDRKAREVAEHRAEKKRARQHAIGSAALSLDNLFNRIEAGDVRELGVVVKGDVQGSVEAIVDALNKMKSDEVKVKVLHSAVGVITENDVMLATASAGRDDYQGATLIVGFNVRADATARKVAEAEGVEMRYYNVIYNLVDDITSALSGLLKPEEKEKIIGHVEIRQIFKINKAKIAGCYVTDGKVIRGGKARLLRDGVVVYEGAVDTLRREKNDAKEVAENYECGLTLENFDDFSEGDILETYEVEQIAREFKATEEKKEKAQEAAE